MSGFALEVELWTEQAAEGLREARANALLDIGSSIIAETPKDTGLARGNWQASLNAPKEEQLPLRPSIAAVAELTKVVGEMQGDETFYFRNNKVYATSLEFGHSGQAPHGMVRKNVERWGGVIAKEAEKVRAA